MKKKRKLRLSRETVRRLGANDLGNVAGGGHDTSLACIQDTGCNCETEQCYDDTMCMASCSCTAETCSC